MAHKEGKGTMQGGGTAVTISIDNCFEALNNHGI